MSLDRREFLKQTALLALTPSLPGRTGEPTGEWVNDVHSQLNRTRVRQVLRPRSVEELQKEVEGAMRARRPVCLSGARHAMGGQQFATDATLVDMRGLGRIGQFDAERGTLDVEAGAEWPKVVAHLIDIQKGAPRQWGISQKQTGTDGLTVGGALAANAHGRGLTLKPFVSDVESFALIDGTGQERRCSRETNPGLFALVAGGYGLFGAVTRVTLRLATRIKLERVVEIGVADELVDRVEKRVAGGFLYGDFQYAVDPGSDDFLREGVFSCYRPVDAKTPVREPQRDLPEQDWRTLLQLAHTDPSRAFERYASYYLSTSGQIYWSDTHQLGVYLENYHRGLDGAIGGQPGTEMITEIYVPRPALASFLDEARRAFRTNGVRVIYGTIRFIEKDEESFLAWAKDRYACVIFNLHTIHTPEGRERAAEAFCSLIDMAIARKGSYYLTYHRWARRDQVLACYPQMPEFLRRKKSYDPDERFQSDWYRHYATMFG